VLWTEGERLGVARCEHLTFAGAASPPDWAHRVDDEPRRKAKPWSDPGFACRATNAWLNLWKLQARPKEGWTGGLVERAIDAAAAQKPLIRSVDDRVDRERRDVSPLDSKTCHGSAQCPWGCSVKSPTLPPNRAPRHLLRCSEPALHPKNSSAGRAGLHR